MLKLRKNAFVLLALTIGIVFLVMACDDGSSNTSSGCGEVVKDIIITVPELAIDAGVEAISFVIEIIDAVTFDVLAEVVALPGESKIVSVTDTGAPVTVRATAYNGAGIKIGVGSETNGFSINHDGLLCDMDVNVGMVSPINPVSGSVSISMDCHIADILERMVEIVENTVEGTIEVWRYVVEDTKEDIINIIDIFI